VLRGAIILDMWLNTLVLTLMGSTAIRLAAFAFFRRHSL
jgi:hypothetical protein